MTTRYLMSTYAPLVFGALLMTGLATAGEMDKEKALLNDTYLTSKTKIALFADSRVKGTQINVETKKGVVMLRGKVDSGEARSAAAEIAKGIDGVKSVKNELQVVAPS
jgi:hyperosmotically inducible periplasmic protein